VADWNLEQNTDSFRASKVYFMINKHQIYLFYSIAPGGNLNENNQQILQNTEMGPTPLLVLLLLRQISPWGLIKYLSIYLSIYLSPSSQWERCPSYTHLVAPSSSHTGEKSLIKEVFQHQQEHHPEGLGGRATKCLRNIRPTAALTGRTITNTTCGSNYMKRGS